MRRPLAWLKWFVKYPDLRLVIAMSPRFQRLAKDPALKAQFQALQKEGRLDIAMQIPNAPLLRASGWNPPYAYPYAYPDDVVQLMAQSKADFFRQWNLLPRGLVLPYGAASPRLLSLLERLGFAWIVGALQAPVVDGPYQSGSADVWDAVADGKPGGTIVQVWDERDMKEKPSGGMDAGERGQNNEILSLTVRSRDGISAARCRDRLEDADLESAGFVRLGSVDPAKNSGWEALRKTREAAGELQKFRPGLRPAAGRRLWRDLQRGKLQLLFLHGEYGAIPRSGRRTPA